MKTTNETFYRARIVNFDIATGNITAVIPQLYGARPVLVAPLIVRSADISRIAPVFPGETVMVITYGNDTSPPVWLPRVRDNDLDNYYLLTAGDSMTGPLLLPDGTAANPALAFVTDPNTGLRRASADQLALVAGGVDRMLIGTTGAAFGGDVSVAGVLTVGGATVWDTGSLLASLRVLTQRFELTIGAAVTAFVNTSAADAISQAVTTVRPNAWVYVTGSFDFRFSGTASGDAAIGIANVNGAALPAQALARPNNNNAILMPSRRWSTIIGSPSTFNAKIQYQRTGATSTIDLQTHTGMLVEVYETIA